MREERLKHVAEVYVSNVDKKIEEGDSAVSLCNYTDVYYNERITNALDFMSATATRDQRTKFGLRKGDVVLTKDSETAEDIGVSALVAEDVPHLVCGYHLAVVRARTGVADGAYLRWALASTAARQRMSAVATGVTRFGLRSEAIADLPMPLPPMPTQRAIANYLDRETARIDALIAAKRRMVALLSEKRRSLIAHIVTHGLDASARTRDSGIAWLDQMPAHWEIRRLKRIGRSIIGLTFDPADTTADGQGVLVLRASNVKDQEINLDDKLHVRTEVPALLRTRLNDILICARSGSRDLIGKNALINEAAAGLTFGAFMTVFRSRYNGFIFYVLNSPLFDYQAGAFSTSTINQLTSETLNAMAVPFPPESEQLQIVTFLRQRCVELDSLQIATRRSVGLLQERRQALITAAVTGQIDIPEAA